MKKTAISLPILLGLLAAALSGCDDVKAKKVDGNEVIFEVGGNDVYADHLLGFDESKLTYDFLNTEEGREAVYGALYNAIAAKRVGEGNSIKAAVEEKMEAWDDEVEDYAKDNSVTIRNAKETKLEELGFEDEKELEAYYLAEIQKSKLEANYLNDYYEPAEGTTTAPNNTLLEDYVNNANPMIMRHILVSVSDKNSIHSLASISTSEADKLVTVLKRLALAKNNAEYSFTNTAMNYSDDNSGSTDSPSSAQRGGSLGIVDRYTSFVNEFKLGVYAELADDTLITTEAKTALDVANNLTTLNILAVGSVLAYVYNDSAKDEQKAKWTAMGNTSEMSSSNYYSEIYPRNVIYNHYINNPKVTYLKVDNTNIDTEITNLLTLCYPHMEAADITTKLGKIKESTYYKSFFTDSTCTTLKTDSINTNADGYVVDDYDNVIRMVKSDSTGIHFITVAKVFTSYTDLTSYGAYVQNTDNATFTKDNLGYSNDNKAIDARENEVKNRVLNYIKGGYNSVSANSSLYEYRMILDYVDQYNIELNDNLETLLNGYITSQQVYQTNAIAEAWASDWEDYTNQVEAYKEMRAIRYE